MAPKPTVLIVDDDVSIRQTMELIIRSAGWRPLTAGLGSEALELCQKNRVDVVLLDVQLPDTSGIKVLAHLREHQPDVGVIIVSVVKEIPVAVEAMKLGALDYLTKDFSPGELSARLGKCLDQLQAGRELAWGCARRSRRAGRSPW
jgi:DNA-binding NtrC family response regulator